MGKNLYLCNIPVSYFLTYIVPIPNLCFTERDMIHYENNQVKCYLFIYCCDAVFLNDMHILIPLFLWLGFIVSTSSEGLI